MASTKEFVDYVAEEVKGLGSITSKKMFGEYMVYINAKPILLICDNTVYIKMKDEISRFMEGSSTGYPYNGAKLHYILDVEDKTLLKDVIPILEKLTDLPKPRVKKSELTKLPNIGPNLEQDLNEIGIDTYQSLVKTGSKAAWLKIQKNDPSACLSRLMALEGAIRKVRWHNLDDASKADLKEFYKKNKTKE